MKKTALLLLFSFLLALFPAGVSPLASADSGTCGEGLSWTLDDAGELTVSGEGEMEAYSPESPAPWYESREAIRKVTVASGVTGISSYAFLDCENLESVLLSDTVTRVGEAEGNVFLGCGKLGTIEVDSGNDCFWSDEGVLLGENCLYCYPAAKEDAYYCLPEDTWGNIYSGAFAGADKLERLYIPEISNIDFPVFSGCNALTKLYLGGDEDFMREYEDMLLSDLPGENVSLFFGATAEQCAAGEDLDPSSGSAGENVTWRVEDGALILSGSGPMEDFGEYHADEDYWSLWSPPWWDWVGDGHPEENRRQIKRLVVEEGVTTAGAGAFRDLDGLESVSLPESLVSVGGYAFHNDILLPEVNIPAGVASIGDSAFENNTALAKVNIPGSVTTIGSWAFCDDTSLTEVEIPAGVVSIGNGAFYACTALKSFRVAEGNPAYRSVDGVLFSADLTELVSYGAGHTASSYTVPEGVRRLHPSAFSYTAALEEVQLPDSLTEIEKWAFGHTGLKRVVLPRRLTALHHGVFGYCEALESVTLPLRLSAMEEEVFVNCTALKDIYYEGTEAQWQNLTKDVKDAVPEGVLLHYEYDAYCAHENLTHHPAVPHGCTADGTVEYWECVSCGARFSGPEARPAQWLDDIRDPAAHSYVSAVTLAPTCAEAGTRTWTCTVCDAATEGHSYSEPIPATGQHHFTDGYCDNLLQDGVTVCGAPEQIAGGTLENGMTWTIDSEGMLHIRGEGEIPNMSVVSLGNNSFYTEAPWWDYHNAITAVRIHSGVTTIGNGCFAGLSSIRSLYVPVTMTDMSQFWTFFQCNALRDVYYEGTKEQWSAVKRFSSNIISIANPFGSGMIKIVDYIGNAEKHYEYDPDRTVDISAPAVNGKTVTATVYTDRAASAWFAVYDGNGRFLGVELRPLTVGEETELSFSAGQEGAARFRLLVLGEDGGTLLRQAGAAL